MYDRALPDGWKILGYGIDGALGNKYIRILLPNGIVASCISGEHTYGGSEGLWEIAPCWYGGGQAFSVMYMNEMRAICDWNDPRGWLDTEGVNEVLSELADIDANRVRILRDAFMQLRNTGR
jgi:hypothetical protein